MKIWKMRKWYCWHRPDRINKKELNLKMQICILEIKNRIMIDKVLEMDKEEPGDHRHLNEVILTKHERILGTILGTDHVRVDKLNQEAEEAIDHRIVTVHLIQIPDLDLDLEVDRIVEVLIRVEVLIVQEVVPDLIQSNFNKKKF